MFVSERDERNVGFTSFMKHNRVAVYKYTTLVWAPATLIGPDLESFDFWHDSKAPIAEKKNILKKNLQINTVTTLLLNGGIMKINIDTSS